MISSSRLIWWRQVEKGAGTSNIRLQYLTYLKVPRYSTWYKRSDLLLLDYDVDYHVSLGDDCWS